LGGISAQVCEISPHNSDFLLIFLDEWWYICFVNG
jgi:hypothetical protein